MMAPALKTEVLASLGRVWSDHVSPLWSTAAPPPGLLAVGTKPPQRFITVELEATGFRPLPHLPEA